METGIDENSEWDRNLTQSLYEKLEKTILPLFYRDREGFTNVMIHSSAINGSFFNTQRMMQQYVLNAYYAR